MDISTISAATPQAQVRAEVSMAILDKTLETARSNAFSLLEVLPAANPAEGNSFDDYA
ncbi:MAG: YjfB family protein [Acidimicrobiia bacterium]|nr:YjfB family protein [Acidimicrobiia bacterium]